MKTVSSLDTGKILANIAHIEHLLTFVPSFIRDSEEAPQRFVALLLTLTSTMIECPRFFRLFPNTVLFLQITDMLHFVFVVA